MTARAPGQKSPSMEDVSDRVVEAMRDVADRVEDGEWRITAAEFERPGPTQDDEGEMRLVFLNEEVHERLGRAFDDGG